MPFQRRARPSLLALTFVYIASDENKGAPKARPFSLSRSTTMAGNGVATWLRRG